MTYQEFVLFLTYIVLLHSSNSFPRSERPSNPPSIVSSVVEGTRPLCRGFFYDPGFDKD